MHDDTILQLYDDKRANDKLVFTKVFVIKAYFDALLLCGDADKKRRERKLLSADYVLRNVATCELVPMIYSLHLARKEITDE